MQAVHQNADPPPGRSKRRREEPHGPALHRIAPDPNVLSSKPSDPWMIDLPRPERTWQADAPLIENPPKAIMTHIGCLNHGRLFNVIISNDQGHKDDIFTSEI